MRNGELGIDEHAGDGISITRGRIEEDTKWAALDKCTADCIEKGREMNRLLQAKLNKSGDNDNMLILLRLHDVVKDSWNQAMISKKKKNSY